MTLVAFELSSSNEVEVWYALHSWCSTRKKPGEREEVGLSSLTAGVPGTSGSGLVDSMSLHCSWGVREVDMKWGGGVVGDEGGRGGRVVGNTETKLNLVRLGPFC